MIEERNSQIKIGFLSTYPPQRCGIATYTYYLVDELKKKVNVEIIQIDNPGSLNPFYFLRLAQRAKKYEIVHIQHEYGLFGFNNVFISYWYNLPLIFLYLRFSRRCKIVTTLHTVNWSSLLLFLLPNIFMVGFSDRIIVHTEIAKSLLVKQGVNKKKICVIPHGVYKNPEMLDKNNCKEILGLENKNILLIFGFVTNKWKNYKIVIDILPSLNKDIILLIAGGPRIRSDVFYYKKLMNYVIRLNLQERVVFYGYVKEKSFPIIFNSADIAILPHKSSTQSGVLNILLAFKMPILAPALRYFQEVKDDYACVELYNPQDKDSLKEKISQLLYNSEKKTQLKNSQTSYYYERNWEKIAELLKSLYINLV